MNLLLSSLCSVHEITLSSVYTGVQPPVPTAALSVPAATMAFVPAPSPTVVDQTTLMKKYLQFVAALTDTNTRKLKKKQKATPKMMYQRSVYLISSLISNAGLHKVPVCRI